MAGEKTTSGKSTIDKMRSALDNGQLGNPVEDGPTPDESEQEAPSATDGPTPEGDPTEEEATVEAEEEVEADAEDEASETSSQETEEEATEEEEGEEESDDEFYFRGEHSQYRTKEEYDNAVDAKDSLLNKQRSEIAELRKELEESNALLESQRQVMPDDYKKELVVRHYIAEELGDEAEDVLSKSEEDLAENPELERKLTKAKAKAEARYELALEEAQKAQKKQVERRQQKLQQADQFVREFVTPKKYGAYSSEERIRLGNFFNEKVGETGLNRAEVAVLMYNDYGKAAAESFLEGLRNDFDGQVEKAVKKELSKSKAKPKPPATPPSEEPEEERKKEKEAQRNQRVSKRSSLDTIFGALQNGQ